jgi:mycothiol synthase
MATSPIVSDVMPAVEGLTFRSLSGERDADAVYELRAACVEQDQVDLLSTSEGLPSREEMHAAVAQILADHQQDRRLLAEIHGDLVGYSLVESWSEDDGRWVYLILGWVLPAWRGRGIGTAMLRWGEQTAQYGVTEERPGEPFEFAANSSSTQPEGTALLLNEGYEVGYTVLEMGLDFSALPPVFPLPEGLEVRLVLPEHYFKLACSISEAYRGEYERGRFHETRPVEDTMAGLMASRHDPALWQVAWLGDEVVGQVTPVIEGGRAFFHDISVRPAWRRRGLARALLTRALWDLRARGVAAIRLNTVAEFRTRARDLYQSVGFRLLKEFPRYRKSPVQPGPAQWARRHPSICANASILGEHPREVAEWQSDRVELPSRSTGPVRASPWGCLAARCLEICVTRQASHAGLAEAACCATMRT